MNGDGQIGGPGLTSKLEQATHIDFNRDGVIGYRPPPGGGIRLLTKVFIIMIYFSLIGLVGQIERATHIDINRDGVIGGRPGQYRPH